MRRRRPRKPALLVRTRPPEAPDPETQRQRETFMQRYDGLPTEIRQALSECLFDIHIGVRNRHWNVEAVVKRIGAIRTMHEAQEFNREFAERQRFARF
jgi:hypothetical protein